MAVRLIIPGEALSLNNAYRSFVARGRIRRALTAEGQAYKGHVGAYARRLPPPPPGVRLSVALTLYGRWDTLAGEPLRRDIDNPAKLILDALCEAWGMDDRWVRELTVRAVHATEARTVVEVRVLSDVERSF